MLYQFTCMRFKFDRWKSWKLKRNPTRGFGLDEVQEVWEHPHYIDSRWENPEQYRAIGWVKEHLVTVIYEIREDESGEYLHLITLWRSTREEQKIYEENI